MNKQTALFRLIRARKKATNDDWWRYVKCVAAGKRAPQKLRVESPLLAPGRELVATDRVYQVQGDGSWRVVRRHDALPAHRSQIRLLPEPPRGNYPKRAAA